MNDWMLRDKICVVGIGTTFDGTSSETDVNCLGMEALRRAVEDAGIATSERYGLEMRLYGRCGGARRPWAEGLLRHGQCLPRHRRGAGRRRRAWAVSPAERARLAPSLNDSPLPYVHS